MSKNNVYESFTQALFFSGSVSIPRFLLDHYCHLGLTDREMMMIIHIMSETSAGNEKSLEEQISKRMGISPLEFRNIIRNLHTKGFLGVQQTSETKIEQNNCLYDFRGLIDQLFELWGINQFRQLESGTTETLNASLNEQNGTSLIKLTAAFEQELGRPLTGFECEHIEKWLLASYSEELIIEALKRGVSAGIRTFRYLDSILREWEKKGLKTRQEVEAEDQNYQDRQGKKGEKHNKPRKTTTKKYDDIYL